jgi:hypothetical protein
MDDVVLICWLQQQQQQQERRWLAMSASCPALEHHACE